MTVLAGQSNTASQGSFQPVTMPSASTSNFKEPSSWLCEDPIVIGPDVLVGALAAQARPGDGPFREPALLN